MSNYFRCVLVGVAVSAGLWPIYGFAHDTNTIHVQITGAAIQVLKEKDGTEEKYSELYEEKNNVLTHWGSSPVLFEVDAVKDEESKYSKFVHPEKNVVDGVVQEDYPVGRVLTHFYHAYSGVPLQLSGFNIPVVNPYTSRQQAIRYFDQAVEVYGYRDYPADTNYVPNTEKSFSYWLFGHSLHHLEDMASIGHVRIR